MKKYIIILILTLSIPILGNSQNLLVANNNPGAASGVNVFTGNDALRDAIAAASTTAPYDVIYVVPSIIAYGSITIDNGITIFGIGIRPDKDLGSSSQVGPISLNSGDVRISGIIGPTSGGISIGFGKSNDTYTNITIENSRFRELRQTNDATLTVGNVLVRNNIIFNDGWGGIEFNVSSNVTITNNVIYCERNGGSFIGNTLNVFNNLFVGDNTSGEKAINEADNCVFDHNIFYGTSVNLTSISTGNVWDDNLSFNTIDNVFDVGLYDNTTNTSNIENDDPLFVSFPPNANWTDARDFTLQALSPALNVNGTDIGPSGGATPFDYEGNILPLIQSVTLPAIIPAGTDLPITIKAKGN